MRLRTPSPDSDHHRFEPTQTPSLVSFEQLEPRLLLSVTIEPVESSESLLSPVDNSAALSGYITQDIVVEAATDWLTAELTVTPDQTGSIFQSSNGSNRPPDSIWFGTFPSLEFDTFVSNGPTSGASDLTFIDEVFDADSIDVSYFNIASSDIGTLTLARITLADGASGTWNFRAFTASNPSVPEFTASGQIVNGHLVESGLASGIVVTITDGDSYSFTDANNDAVTYSLRGNGTSELYFDDVGAQDIDRIVLSGTDAASSLAIKTKGSGASTTVGQILVQDGSLSKIQAKTTDLVGAGLEATDSGVAQGFVSSIQIRDIKNGADIILPGTDATKGITIKAGRLQADTDITLGSYLKGLTVVDWTGSSLNAPWASKISVKGNRRAGIVGDLGADMTFTGTDPRKGLSLGKLQVPGTLTGSTIIAPGSIGTIMLGAIDGTDVLVGIDGGATRHAALHGDFTNLNAFIKSIKIKGLKLAKGDPIPRFVTNSNFSAATIGSVSLVNVELDNGSESFGLWAYDAPLSEQEIKSVSHKDTLTGERWKWPFKDGSIFDDPDLVIQII